MEFQTSWKILIWDKTKKLVKIGPFHEYLKNEKHYWAFYTQ
jgi:hypothetical protein